MKKKNYNLSVTAFILLCMLSISAIAKNKVTQLVCEYKTNPLGIDVTVPRLSWQLSSSEKDVMQLAYEVRVAESIGKLNSAFIAGPPWSE